MSLSALRFDLISLIAEYAALNPHPLPRWACDPNSRDLVSIVQRVNFQSSTCGRGGAVTGLCVLEEEHGGLTAFYKRVLTNPCLVLPGTLTFTGFEFLNYSAVL